MCGLSLTGTGKSSVIPLPGDRLIITSPNSKTVATNLDDPSKSVTLDVNGAGHLSIDPQGNLRLVATGRNLVQDPGLNIMVLISGRFEFVFDPNTGLLTDLVGNGQLLDICAMID